MDMPRGKAKKHGHSPHRSKTREYNSWQHMKDRCQNPRTEFYHLYGGRGITVCERWQIFENFLADMGPRPLGTSLERMNNEGNYEPANCRWATPKDQGLNRRNDRINRNRRKRDRSPRMGEPEGEDDGSGGSAGEQ